MNDRRKLERFELHVPAKVEVTGESGKREILQLETLDISADGAFFISEKSITEGAHIKLEMVLSMEKLQQLIGQRKQIGLKINGTVIRSDSQGIAVHFDKKYQISALNGLNSNGGKITK